MLSESFECISSLNMFLLQRVLNKIIHCIHVRVH